jgi:hypothetical protein
VDGTRSGLSVGRGATPLDSDGGKLPGSWCGGARDGDVDDAALQGHVQLDGYRADRVETLAWIVGACAEGLLVLGGYLGGAIVFVYRMRVLGSPNTPPAKALGLRARCTSTCRACW